ncbi:MAG: Chromate transport protein [Clostridia bacterium 41_269]|nr:MAG: Chromate transport protein [Clostridia bacterium 41_269]
MLFELFLSFIIIGAFSFGGGNAMFPILLRELVHKHGWLTSKEMIDLFAFAQMTPGPVATNAATYVGYKIGGILGAAVATIGVSLPSAAAMLILLRLMAGHKASCHTQNLFAGLRPVVVALILYAGIVITKQSVHDPLGYFLILGNILGALFLDVNPIILIIISGMLGLIFS